MSECPHLSEMPLKLGKEIYFSQEPNISNPNTKVVLKIEAKNIVTLGYELVIQIFRGKEWNKKR